MKLTLTTKRIVFGGLACLFVLATALSALIATHKSQAVGLNIPQRVVETGARSDAVGSSVAPSRTATLRSLPHIPGVGHSMPARSFYSPSVLAARKAAATHDHSVAAIPSSAAPLPQGSTQTPNPGTAFLAQSENGLSPSDMGLAVGSGDIVQVVNSEIAVYSTSGTVLVPSTSVNMFYGLNSSYYLFDPRVVFDSNHNRFIILIDDVEGAPFTTNTQAAYYRVAVSNTSDPTGTYTIFDFSVGENLGASNATWSDFPGLGIDNEAIYMSGNRFTFSSSPSFVNTFVRSENLAQLESGATVVGYQFDNLSTGDGPAFSVEPAITFGSPRAEVMVSTDFNTGGLGYYIAWAFSNPLSIGGHPRLSYAKLGGTYYNIPPPANQPGVGGVQSIDTGDFRVSGQPVFFDGSIYYAINTDYNNGSGTNVSAVRWLANGVSFDQGNSACGASPNRCVDLDSMWWRDYATIGYSSTADAYYGSVAVDSDGNLWMDFTISSTYSRPYGAIYGHRVTIKLLEVGTAAIGVSGATSGTGFYSQNRWGDYSAIALDPSACTGSGINVHCNKVFFSGMAVDNAGNWKTYIGNDAYTINNS